MQKTSRKPRKSFQKRNSTQSNAAVNGPDIFKLISSIPKTSRTCLPFTNQKLNLKFATVLLKFCEQMFPEKLKELFFYQNQELDSLIFELSDLIFSKEIKILYEEQSIEANNCIDFIYKEEKYDWCWYIMEAKHFKQIESRELKTAFFKLLRKFSGSTEVTFLDHTFDDGSDSHFEEVVDYFEMSYDEYILEGNEDNYPGTFEEYFYSNTQSIRDCLVEFNIHINLDLNNEIFNSYRPKNEFESKLKSLLKEGLDDIDFSIIHKFADNINPYPSGQYEDDEAFPFSSSFMVLYDSDDAFEEELLSNLNDRANGMEVTYPASYYRYQNKKLTRGTTEEDSKKLKRTCEFLTEIAILFEP